MRAGDYDKYVQIQENQPTTEAHNVKKDNWVTIQSVFCSINTASAKEIQQNSDIQIDKAIIKMWPITLTNANGILHGSDFYEIQAVRSINDELVINATLVHE